MTCSFSQIQFTQTHKIRFSPNDMLGRWYLWLCQSFLSAMHQNVLICFPEMQAQSKSPASPMSLTRFRLYIPIPDGLRRLIIVAVLTLSCLLGQNLYFPLIIPLGICSCCSAPYLISFNPSQDYKIKSDVEIGSWARIIIILERIEFSVSVFSYSSVKVSSNWLHI